MNDASDRERKVEWGIQEEGDLMALDRSSGRAQFAQGVRLCPARVYAEQRGSWNDIHIHIFPALNTPGASRNANRQGSKALLKKGSCPETTDVGTGRSFGDE